MAEPIISFDHVSKRFGDGPIAVEDLDFEIEKGEIVSVVGVTGCGKSTAFNMILGLLPPTGGTVRVEGRDPKAEFEWFRGRMAVVFQDPRLLPWRSVIDNVCTGMRFAGIDKAEWDSRARHWLGRLGLEGREDEWVHQLSGGQRQRVAIARAFAVDPGIVLCDESFSALDEVTARQLRAEFRDLVHAGDKTAIVITHSIPEALSVADRVLVFRPPGRVADDLRLDPATDDHAALQDHVLEKMGPSALSRQEAEDADADAVTVT